jgi:hypothetical protein
MVTALTHVVTTPCTTLTRERTRRLLKFKSCTITGHFHMLYLFINNYKTHFEVRSHPICDTDSTDTHWSCTLFFLIISEVLSRIYWRGAHIVIILSHGTRTSDSHGRLPDTRRPMAHGLGRPSHRDAPPVDLVFDVSLLSPHGSRRRAIHPHTLPLYGTSERLACHEDCA